MRQAFQVVVVRRVDGLAAGVEQAQRVRAGDAEMKWCLEVLREAQTVCAVVLGAGPAAQAVVRGIAPGVSGFVNSLQAIGPVGEQCDRQLLTRAIGAGDVAPVTHRFAADDVARAGSGSGGRGLLTGSKAGGEACGNGQSCNVHHAADSCAVFVVCVLHQFRIMAVQFQGWWILWRSL